MTLEGELKTKGLGPGPRLLILGAIAVGLCLLLMTIMPSWLEREEAAGKAAAALPIWEEAWASFERCLLEGRVAESDRTQALLLVAREDGDFPLRARRCHKALETDAGKWSLYSQHKTPLIQEVQDFYRGVKELEPTSANWSDLARAEAMQGYCLKMDRTGQGLRAIATSLDTEIGWVDRECEDIDKTAATLSELTLPGGLLLGVRKMGPPVSRVDAGWLQLRAGGRGWTGKAGRNLTGQEVESPTWMRTKDGKTWQLVVQQEEFGPSSAFDWTQEGTLWTVIRVDKNAKGALYDLMVNRDAKRWQSVAKLPGYFIPTQLKGLKNGEVVVLGLQLHPDLHWKHVDVVAMRLNAGGETVAKKIILQDSHEARPRLPMARLEADGAITAFVFHKVSTSHRLTIVHQSADWKKASTSTASFEPGKDRVVACASGQVQWAVTSGQLLNSRDGGATWTAKPLPALEDGMRRRVFSSSCVSGQAAFVEALDGPGMNVLRLLRCDAEKCVEGMSVNSSYKTSMAVSWVEESSRVLTRELDLAFYWACPREIGEPCELESVFNYEASKTKKAPKAIFHDGRVFTMTSSGGSF
jgi:hypothetical protein